MQPSPQAPPYTDAPPSYSEIYQPRFIHPQAAQGQLHQMSSAYPGAQMYLPLHQSIAMGPMGHGLPMAYYPMGALYPPGSTMLVDGGFDSGARYGAGSNATIPVTPPPPGQLPSAAQLAAMQGANMMMAQQRKGSYFMGGAGTGGYTIW
ncbi:DAZ-associated protein 2 isoform X2 [Conger conger]|nr:DAZ-associated protein 2 isoform X2 [Conger conger]